jgi:hypothetical protein
MEQSLSAILAADGVAYFALMEQDEPGTFDRLRAHRKELNTTTQFTRPYASLAPSGKGLPLSPSSRVSLTPPEPR